MLEASSVSYGKATAFLPLADLLRAYVRIDDRDDTRSVRAKVTGTLLTLDRTLEDALPAVLWLLDAIGPDDAFLALEPAQRRQRALDGVKRLLLRESQVQPLLLVFEDLHWIDAETQRVLDSLVESLPTAAVFLAGSKTYYRQARIDPLPPESADELLRTLLGEDPSLGPLKPLLIGRTEGNPLFLEESVRTLVETAFSPASPARIDWQGRWRPSRCRRASRRSWPRDRPPASRDEAAAPGARRAPRGDRRNARGRAPALPRRASDGCVPLRGASLPRPRVHVQARAHPRGCVRERAPGPTTRATPRWWRRSSGSMPTHSPGRSRSSPTTR